MRTMDDEFRSKSDDIINPFKLIDDIPAEKPLPRLDVIGNEPITGPVIGGEAPGAYTEEPIVEEVAAEVTPPEGDGLEWYFVNCYSGYENKVKISLNQRIETMGAHDLIKRIVVPTEQETEVKDGKRRTVEKKLFPGYLLVQMKINEQSLIVVKGTPGVSRFVGMGDQPTALSKTEVDNILKRMQSEAPKLKVNFRPGQKVRITDGPFADFMGLVDKIDTERAKVSVLVSFFGRETPVELDFLQVERM